MVTVSDVDVASLAVRILDDSWRSELFVAMKHERLPHRPLTEGFGHAVARMDATAEQLRELVRLFEVEQRDRALAELLFHPALPEDLLLQFCERGMFLETLGHRGGPRRLLARTAALHAYPEAIVSLGLDLFRDPAVPVDQFAAFTRVHGQHAWMLRSLAEVDASDPSKDAHYEGLLASVPVAAAYRARHLALSRSCATERLGVFLEGHDDPRVLVLLLKSHIEDPAKRAMVHARAAARADQPEIAIETTRSLARTRAAAPDLLPAIARELLAAGDAEVLLVLADNPATPRDVLEALVQTQASTRARHIRSRARATLERRVGAEATRRTAESRG